MPPCVHVSFKTRKHACRNIYIITQVILAFSLVLAYDLLEDRRTIAVIIAKLFPRRFKMAESFEYLDNILRDWANGEVAEKSC